MEIEVTGRRGAPVLFWLALLLLELSWALWLAHRNWICCFEVLWDNCVWLQVTCPLLLSLEGKNLFTFHCLVPWSLLKQPSAHPGITSKKFWHSRLQSLNSSAFWAGDIQGRITRKSNEKQHREPHLAQESPYTDNFNATRHHSSPTPSFEISPGHKHLHGFSPGVQPPAASNGDEGAGAESRALNVTKSCPRESGFLFQKQKPKEAIFQFLKSIKSRDEMVFHLLLLNFWIRMSFPWMLTSWLWNLTLLEEKKGHIFIPRNNR